MCEYIIEARGYLCLKKFLNTEIFELEEEVGYVTDRETVKLEFYLPSDIRFTAKKKKKNPHMNAMKQRPQWACRTHLCNTRKISQGVLKTSPHAKR
jgi:hypothetical protein